MKHLNGWLGIARIFLSCSVQIITSPSYVMFSIVALGLGTMGIWVTFFPNGPDLSGPISNQIDNLAVFTFCIATLGSMATEYFFEEKGKEYTDIALNETELEKIQARHLAFFVWTVSLLLAFLALQRDSGIWLGLGSTLVLWIYVNIHRPKFQAISKAALDTLNPNYDSDENGDLGGVGL